MKLSQLTILAFAALTVTACVEAPYGGGGYYGNHGPHYSGYSGGGYYGRQVWRE